MKIFITNSSSETQSLAEEFAKSLKRGEIIAMYGDLGSGKTTFVQGLAKGLGIKRRIISPTFIIIRSYNIKNSRGAGSRSARQNLKLFYHIDLYRLKNEKYTKGLGIDEIINDPQNIVAIEWAEKMGNLLPKDRIDIRFAYLSEKKMKITFNIKNQISKIKNTD